MLTEIHLCLTTCQILSDHDKHAEAADQLAVAEDILHLAIDCGAMVDPWNILGFQGLYPLFPSREDSTHDHGNEELIDALTRQFDLYARGLIGCKCGYQAERARTVDLERAEAACKLA